MMDTAIVASVQIAACAGTCHHSEMQGSRKETCTWQGDQEPQGMCEILRRREACTSMPVTDSLPFVLLSQTHSAKRLSSHHACNNDVQTCDGMRARSTPFANRSHRTRVGANIMLTCACEKEITGGDACGMCVGAHPERLNSRQFCPVS
jgi:hypothetical protein